MRKPAIVCVFIGACQIYAGSTAAILASCNQLADPTWSTIVDSQSSSAAALLPQTLPALSLCNAVDPAHNGGIVVNSQPFSRGQLGASGGLLILDFGAGVQGTALVNPYGYDWTIAESAHLDFYGVVTGGTGHGFIRGTTTFSSDGSTNPVLHHTTVATNWTTVPFSGLTQLFSFPFDFGVPFTWTLDGSVDVSGRNSIGGGWGIAFTSFVTSIRDDSGNPIPAAQIIAAPEPEYAIPMLLIGVAGFLLRARFRSRWTG